MTTKIELFNVKREDLSGTQEAVNAFLATKKAVTKVFLSPGYSIANTSTYSPIILVVYDE